MSWSDPPARARAHTHVGSSRCSARYTLDTHSAEAAEAQALLLVHRVAAACPALTGAIVQAGARLTERLHRFCALATAKPPHRAPPLGLPADAAPAMRRWVLRMLGPWARSMTIGLPPPPPPFADPAATAAAAAAAASSSTQAEALFSLARLALLAPGGAPLVGEGYSLGASLAAANHSAGPDAGAAMLADVLDLWKHAAVAVPPPSTPSAIPGGVEEAGAASEGPAPPNMGPLLQHIVARLAGPPGAPPERGPDAVTVAAADRVLLALYQIHAPAVIEALVPLASAAAWHALLQQQMNALAAVARRHADQRERYEAFEAAMAEYTRLELAQREFTEATRRYEAQLTEEVEEEVCIREERGGEEYGGMFCTEEKRKKAPAV